MHSRPRFSTVLLGCLMLVCSPGTASAAGDKIAPPGTAGVNQYLEDVPSAGGNRPSSTVVPQTRSPVHGAAGPAVARSLTHLSKLSGEGARAAALAAAGMPSRSGAAHSHVPDTKGAAQPAAGSASGSPGAALARAVGGSSGGMGALLPAILGATAAAAALAYVVRRRRA